jgi:hypothetical protein
MNLCRTLLLLGLVASGLSMYDTLSHAWDPSFEAPALPLGRRHTNYHQRPNRWLEIAESVV